MCKFVLDCRSLGLYAASLGLEWTWRAPLNSRATWPAAPTTDVNTCGHLTNEEQEWPAHLDLALGFVLGAGLLSARLLALQEEPGYV